VSGDLKHVIWFQVFVAVTRNITVWRRAAGNSLPTVGVTNCFYLYSRRPGYEGSMYIREVCKEFSKRGCGGKVGAGSNVALLNMNLTTRCSRSITPRFRWRAHFVVRPHYTVVDYRWNVMAYGDTRQGKWRGMEWVASTLHTTSEHGVSSITTADAHTSAASSRLDWRPSPI